jgi:molybdate transport system permease protein
MDFTRSPLWLMKRGELTMDEFILSEPERQAIRLSLLVATVAVAGCLPPATLLAWWMARRDFPGKSVVETILNMPLVLPPVVTGYLLLVAFGTQGWLGRFLDEWLGVQIIFTWRAAALASGVIAFPLMVRPIRVALMGVDPRLEQAALTLGAHPIRVFFTITIPLARHGLIAGAILGFARSIGEFGATIMIAGSIPGQTRTMPLYIFSAIEAPDGMSKAQQMVIVSILIAALALIAGEVLERRMRRQGAAQ